MKLKFNVENGLLHYFRISCILLSILAFSLTSCNNASRALTKNEMKAIINKQNEIIGRYFKDGNADSLAMMYTDSAKLSPNGSRFIIGRDSIKAFWRNDFKSSKLLKMETNTLTIDGNKNILYETGNTFSDIVYKDSVYHVKVKYINVWRKQSNGDYKLDVDFWNADTE